MRGAHTWFIILAIGALLAWGISYALELQKEDLGRKKDRQSLLELKEELLDRLATLESERESGAVAEPRYRKQHRELRQKLSRILEQLGAKKAQEQS
jgi:Tfp pilus assembly protein PilO